MPGLSRSGLLPFRLEVSVPWGTCQATVRRREGGSVQAREDGRMGMSRHGEGGGDAGWMEAGRNELSAWNLARAADVTGELLLGSNLKPSREVELTPVRLPILKEVSRQDRTGKGVWAVQKGAGEHRGRGRRGNDERRGRRGWHERAGPQGRSRRRERGDRCAITP